MKKKENYWSLSERCKESLNSKPFICLSAFQEENNFKSLPFSPKLLEKFCSYIKNINIYFKGSTFCIYDSQIENIIDYIKKEKKSFIPLVVFEYGKSEVYNIPFLISNKKKMTDLFFTLKKDNNKLLFTLKYLHNKLLIILRTKYYAYS